MSESKAKDLERQLAITQAHSNIDEMMVEFRTTHQGREPDEFVFAKLRATDTILRGYYVFAAESGAMKLHVPAFHSAIAMMVMNMLTDVVYRTKIDDLTPKQQLDLIMDFMINHMADALEKKQAAVDAANSPN